MNATIPKVLQHLHDLPSPQGVPDSSYQRVFELDGDGSRIYEELAVLFGGDLSYVPGNPDATAFNEGARAVVLYISARIDRVYHSKGEGSR